MVTKCLFNTKSFNKSLIKAYIESHYKKSWKRNRSCHESTRTAPFPIPRGNRPGSNQPRDIKHRREFGSRESTHHRANPPFPPSTFCFTDFLTSFIRNLRGIDENPIDRPGDNGKECRCTSFSLSRGKTGHLQEVHQQMIEKIKFC